MKGLALWALGFAPGAAAGWLAAEAWTRRGRPRDLYEGDERADRVTASAVRAADAAADLPPGARLDVLVRLLASRAAERTGLRCMVVLRDLEGGPIVVAGVSRGSDVRLLEMPIEPDSWVGRAVTDGIPTVAPRVGPVMRIAVGDRRRPLEGGVAVPIRSPTRVEGAVVALGEPLMAPGEAIRRIEALILRFAPVLAPAHEVAMADRRANTDELTGLANRRSLNRAMATGETTRAALVMLDLDFFKRINDTLGHGAGDLALRHVADLLRIGIRSGDVAARIGGEEFAVWLPGADMTLGLEVAERLRSLVEGKPFRTGGTEYPLTISCGVSASPIPIPSPENLWSTADSALYQAKHLGRNRVVATSGRAG